MRYFPPGSFHGRLLCDKIVRDIRNNEDPIVTVVARRRKGKSTFAILLADFLVKNYPLAGLNFSIQEHLHTNPVKLVKDVDRSEKTVIIDDEAGSHLDPQTQWELQNSVIKIMTETQGYKQDVLIFIAPHRKFISPFVWTMSDYYIWIRKKGQARVYINSEMEISTKYSDWPANIYYVIDFGELTQEQSDQYIPRKIENAKEIMSNLIKKIDIPPLPPNISLQEVKILLSTTSGEVYRQAMSKYHELKMAEIKKQLQTVKKPE